MTMSFHKFAVRDAVGGHQRVLHLVALALAGAVPA